MIDVVEKFDQKPVCPHCKNEIKTVWYQALSTFLGRRFIYFCSHCRSVLGVSHRKGFWMG